MQSLFRTGPRIGKRDPLGPRGERVAARMLKRKRYRILNRNLTTPVGEADLVCLAPDGKTIVIVEVKARRMHAENTAFAPEVAVGGRKQRKLLIVAQVIAKRKGWTDRPLRIDVVAIEFHKKGKPTIRHHENAVTL